MEDGQNKRIKGSLERYKVQCNLKGVAGPEKCAKDEWKRTEKRLVKTQTDRYVSSSEMEILPSKVRRSMIIENWVR